jgi:GtrA-like protein.
MSKYKNLINAPLIRYLINSIGVTVIDTIIVWIFYQSLHFDLVIANTIGVVTGFVIHYLISSKSVFHTGFGFQGFVIYFGTFLVGLVFADWIIYIGEQQLSIWMNENMSFLISKGMSIVLPFFLLYYLRKYLFLLLNKWKDRVNQFN